MSKTPLNTNEATEEREEGSLGSLAEVVEMSEFSKRWRYSWGKGLVASYVARGKRKHESLVKMLKTSLQRGIISHSDLERVFIEVENETIEPFPNQPIRRKRFEPLKRDMSLVSR